MVAIRNADAAAAPVTVRSLSRSYGGAPVLEGLDLDVAAGEILAIMGRSGSGKSTLLNLIGALDSPDGGTVMHAGTDLAGMSDSARTRFRRESLGFVFQFFNLIPTLSARDNIALPLALNDWTPADTDGRVDELLGALDIAGVAPRFPDQLSGGEQQRVAIARAVAHRPGIIIADEPTGNLDDESARHTLDMLRRICRDTPATLLIATHSTEAAEIADRVLYLRDGRLVDD